MIYVRKSCYAQTHSASRLHVLRSERQDVLLDLVETGAKCGSTTLQQMCQSCLVTVQLREHRTPRGDMLLKF